MIDGDWLKVTLTSTLPGQPSDAALTSWQELPSVAYIIFEVCPGNVAKGFRTDEMFYLSVALITV